MKRVRKVVSHTWSTFRKQCDAPEMDEAYHAALRAFAGGAARAVLVEGLGDRAFCSGARQTLCVPPLGQLCWSTGLSGGLAAVEAVCAGGDVKSVRAAVLADPYPDAPPPTHPAARVCLTFTSLL